jgi:LacI family transcriptional regulator
MQSPRQRPSIRTANHDNRTIGVIFQPDRSDILTGMRHHLLILDGIITTATSRRWRVTLAPVSRWQDSVIDLPTYLNGAILFGPAQDCPIVPALTQARLPFVVVHRERYYPNSSRIDIDDEAAMKGIVAYLLTCGHRRIHFLHWSLSSDIVQMRWRGYQAALSEAGLVPDAPIHLSESIQAASHVLRDLMRRPCESRPTALACANDEIALKILNAAREIGVSVPGEISVTGLDDLPEAAQSSPPLTTVAQPLREMGVHAARRLISEILGDDTPGERIILPTRCVKRDSVTVLTPPSGRPAVSWWNDPMGSRLGA